MQLSTSADDLKMLWQFASEDPKRRAALLAARRRRQMNARSLVRVAHRRKEGPGLSSTLMDDDLRRSSNAGPWLVRYITPRRDLEEALERMRQRN